MIHRHLVHDRPTLAALDDILENGTLADWQPILAMVRDQPHGQVATRLDHLLAARDHQETGALWLAYLRSVRARPGGDRPPSREGTDPPSRDGADSRAQ